MIPRQLTELDAPTSKMRTSLVIITRAEKFVLFFKSCPYYCVLHFLPGDQILDVDGVNVSNMTIEQVSEVLKSAPILMTCTVKPANHFKYAAEEPTQTTKSSYAEIDIDALAIEDQNANHEMENIQAGYEDDQSSTGSQSYVIMPSDEELDDDEHVYENSKVDHSKHEDTDESEYVNMPNQDGESLKQARSPMAASPRQPNSPGAQRNYLELYFEES